jgi:hypothetical protein
MNVRPKEADDEGYLSYVTGGNPGVIADINTVIGVRLPAGTGVVEARAYVRSLLVRATAAVPELEFEYAVCDADVVE